MLIKMMCQTMPNTIQIAVDILIALLTGGILLFFLEILHLEGSVSREFKEVMNPFYHKLSKYLVVLNYYRFSLRADKNDLQEKEFEKQIEGISRKGLEAVTSGRDITYLSAKDLDILCEEINNIWYVLDRGGQLMRNLRIDNNISKDEAIEAINESFPGYTGKPLDVSLLYDLSGRFYNKVWEPVQHCTHNYEYFQDEEKKARRLLITGLGLTLLSLISIMIWVNMMPVILPCVFVFLSSVILAISLWLLHHVSYISKRLIRSTRDEINANHISISDMMKKVVHWFEPVGYALLLASFGWQCIEERSNQLKLEGYFLETNEKLIYIWEGIYDEALHSERYHGNAISSVNYDTINTHIKDWSQVKENMSTHEHQSNLFFWIRAFLYTLGTILIIVSKWPKSKKEPDNF